VENLTPVVGRREDEVCELITNFVAALFVDWFPEMSTTIASTIHVPLVKVTMSQDETLIDFTKLQESTFPFVSVAVKVTVSPSLALGIPNVGVLSFVTLSDCESPLSEFAARSGATGFAGVVSMSNDSPDDDGDRLPEASVIVAEISHVPSVNVPKVQLVAGTT